jgi:hypothetical protein
MMPHFTLKFVQSSETMTLASQPEPVEMSLVVVHRVFLVVVAIIMFADFVVDLTAIAVNLILSHPPSPCNTE